MSAALIHSELSKQASEDTIYHCLYGFYFLGLKKIELAQIYARSKTTISNWITKFEKEGHVARKEGFVEDIYRKFNAQKRKWLLQLYKEKPI